jgi:hypothetical protein
MGDCVAGGNHAAGLGGKARQPASPDAAHTVDGGQVSRKKARRQVDPRLALHAYCMHMSKNVNLDDEAIAALDAYRREGESYSKVIKRKVGPPIRTFGDLEKALNQIDGPILDLDRVEKIRRTARRSKRG